MRAGKLKIVRSTEGAAAIEFALLLPLLLLVFYGMLTFSNYILVSRRIDGAVNDISFLLSREGQIAYTMDSQQRYTGGQQYLDSLVSTAVPILMFPFIANDYDYNVKMVGTPFYSSIATDPCNENDKEMKVMWSESNPTAKTASFPVDYSITCDNQSFNTGTGVQNYAFSTYHASNSISNSADGVTSYLPGQAFIVMGLSYPYNQGDPNGPSYLGNTVLGGLKFFALGIPGMPIELKRMAAYPVRFAGLRDINGDGIISANELRTELQICTDCNKLTSQLTTGSSDRTACDSTNVLDIYFGGCNFSIF